MQANIEAKMSNSEAGMNQQQQTAPVVDDGPMNPAKQQGSHVPPSTDRSTDSVSYPQVIAPAEEPGSSFGAPPMGDPAEPSSHPDNRTAAEGTTGAAPAAPEGPVSGAQGGLRRQQSGVNGTQADRGVGGLQSNNSVPVGNSWGENNYRQTPTQPGMTGPTTGVGQQPGSPYVQTAEVPPTGKGPMNLIMENLNKWAAKAEGIAGNVWGHLRTGPNVRETAWGRMTHGTRLLTEGGFEGVYKQTFGETDNEQLRKTYACYLSTSTGPVAGTLYISNLKFAFCSDRPLSYAPAPGEQAWSYYKVVIPLDKVREVVPSVNENKPNEKYIQVLTNDGHDFWFMGFVNYDKGVTNMQDALQHIGVVNPGGGLKSPFFSGCRNRDVPAQNMGQQTASGTQDYANSGQRNSVPSSQAAEPMDRQPANDGQPQYTN